MTSRKYILFTAISVLIISLALQGISWAESRLIPPASPSYDPRPSILPVKEPWIWQNHLEGIDYTMWKYADGTIIALRNAWQIGMPTVNTAATDRIYPGGYEVYVPWGKRKISCEARRKATDLFGNIFDVCQAAPFEFVDYLTKRTGRSERGAVWIITPPASGEIRAPDTGRQAPDTTGNQPKWGR